jgi:hypothetical protein
MAHQPTSGSEIGNRLEIHLGLHRYVMRWTLPLLVGIHKINPFVPKCKWTNNYNYYAWFEVLTPVLIGIEIFWAVKPFRLVESHHFSSVEGIGVHYFRAAWLKRTENCSSERLVIISHSTTWNFPKEFNILYWLFCLSPFVKLVLGHRANCKTRRFLHT